MHPAAAQARDALPEVPVLAGAQGGVETTGAFDHGAVDQHGVDRHRAGAGKGLERRARHLRFAVHRRQRAVGHDALVVAVRGHRARRGVERAVQALQKVRVEPVVAVEEDDAPAARGGQADVARRRRTAGAAARQRDQACIALRIGRHQRGCAVGRAVIDDQCLPVAVALRKHAVERVRQRAGGIERRDDERGARRGAHRSPLRWRK